MATPQYWTSGWLKVPLETGRIAFDGGYPQASYLPVSTGVVTLNSGTTVPVSNVNVTASSQIVFTLKTVGGTPSAAPFLTAVTAGSGFSVNGGGSDTSVYNFAIIG
jgi:hypothetical protein